MQRQYSFILVGIVLLGLGLEDREDQFLLAQAPSAVQVQILGEDQQVRDLHVLQFFQVHTFLRCEGDLDAS